ncbi:glycosyl hydrolase [Fibrivirga algicola]|uniref:Glycoside hydrolase family 2 protein n=1 Tax=Fibrivirga algicola TaxID=2950420 RepID=A0ABX0QCC3_9BACT|nr:glycosyl hydrolase [Fibrivirga algicola]NID10031.1 glycoside hydrolase family 2 protein [Fibrivirga algicola]
MKKYTVPGLLLTALLTAGQTAYSQPKWPTITQQAKPWTRWWWMGSAVNDADLTRLMEKYQKAGLGGVEITPIYGVKGEEKQFISFLSPKWMDRLTHTLTEAQRLGMGVDLAQASGWPFGGPWVTPEDACKYVAYNSYTVKGGESLKEPVSYMQKPLMRVVGEPIDIKKLIDPIAKNPDLQLHAFDQVRFEKPLPLQSLMAYPDKGEPVELTNRVDKSGTLNWVAPEGKWTLFAVFEGWHGKQVERAGPGGEGDVIDHFSKTATDHYLQRFDQAFKGYNLKSLRAFFNDSYEVDDASGEGNWTPNMFAEFSKRRGYDLKAHLPALFGKDTDETNKRVLSDYRETISELLLENYTKTWSTWAKGKGKLIRNQAHGSPANILDLYAITDIPEIEGTELLRIKFASSAAHVMGKQLASSESATWDNEHFLSKLSDIKKDMDRFLLGGVNHTFYHGTNYSPQSAAWPGWLFYAAVHFNPNNSFWTDFSQLNTYVARCQSFLQAGKPDNDVLVYLPIYDAYTRPGKVLLQHFDGIDHGFKGLPVEEQTESMLEKGYAFDFISDKQLLGVTTTGGKLQTGGVAYKTILVPEAKYMPLGTFQQLVKLATSGATVIFAGGMPEDVNGMGNLEARRATFKNLLASLKFANQKGVERAAVGKGAILTGKKADQLLSAAGVNRELMIDKGLQCIRRATKTGHYYFIANWGEKAIDGWVPLQATAKSAALYNPMTGKTGMASFRKVGDAVAGSSEVYLQLAPGESCMLDLTQTAVSGPTYAYRKATGPAQPITGNWTINFVKGGPELPKPVQTTDLGSWTKLEGDAVKKFSGTATYSITFSMPAGMANDYLLDLGGVAESAQVQLNGINLGTLLGPVYQVTVPKQAMKATNTLVVTVSNSMANRIIDMDKNRLVWKKFYNINMSARLKENRGADGNFTAENWDLKSSGLLGPVTITPVGEVSVK